MAFETVFIIDTSSIKYGSGATREVGHDMEQFDVKRVMVVTDPNLADSEPVKVTLAALRTVGMDAVLFDQVRVEPTDASFKEAIRFASQGRFEGYIAVGGGSSMDTAKVANLYATHPADFLAYVNPPLGEGRAVPGRLKPLIAIPTTAGTGSETTGVAVFDFLDLHVKTGIAHRSLRPLLGIVDPDNTRTLPRMVAACTGLDVLSHALESLTAIPFSARPAPENPKLRPSYQGSNPISDIWSARAIEMVSKNLLRVLENPNDDEARNAMALAATFAGIGFGNAGVHLPHAMAYPVAGMVRSYTPPGYPAHHPMIPHGMSVILNAPAVFRFTAPANPQRHLYAAGLMGLDVSEVKAEDVGGLLSDAIIALMRKTGMPNGLRAVGFSLDDVDRLVAGTLDQQRLTKQAPRSASARDIRQLFFESMTLW